MVLITGILSPYQNAAVASTSNDEGDIGGKGDEGQESPPVDGEDGSTSNNEGNIDGGNNNNNDDDTTGTSDNNVPPAQDNTGDVSSACHPVESGVPNYTDDNGCLVPCPTPSTDDNEAGNIPEECSQSLNTNLTTRTDRRDTTTITTATISTGSYRRNTKSI